MQNNPNNNAGVIVVVVIVALGGAIWWWDSERPKNKIQNTWTARADDGYVSMTFKDGTVVMSLNTREGRLTAYGRYTWVKDDTISVAFHQASISTPQGTFSASAGALPFHSGRLKVEELTKKELILRDDAGIAVSFTRL